MKCIEAKPGGYIPIGRQGENAALLVRFPTADLVGEFGTGGVYSVTHQRNTDMNAYPVATSQDADYVYWQITATDTAVDGIGDCQLTYLVSGTVARTVKYKTFVGESLDPGEAPESLDTWIDRMQVILGEYATSAYESMTDAAASKEAAASSASDAEAYAKGTRAGSVIPSTDPVYHNNAKYYAEQSDGSAEAAAGSATNAAGSATAAAGSATNAAGSAAAQLQRREARRMPQARQRKRKRPKTRRHRAKRMLQDPRRQRREARRTPQARQQQRKRLKMRRHRAKRTLLHRQRKQSVSNNLFRPIIRHCPQRLQRSKHCPCFILAPEIKSMSIRRINDTWQIIL